MQHADRRHFLKLAGLAGVTFTAGLFPQRGSAQGSDFHFVQFSDTHWGYRGAANPDAEHTLEKAVATVNGGLTDGLIILAVVVGVQQFEGDVIMPLVFGQTLRLHPLVVLLGVTAGGIAFGLFGAFLAVPLIAVAVAIDEAISEDSETNLISLARG